MAEKGFRRGVGAGLLAAALGVGAFLAAGTFASAQTSDSTAPPSTDQAPSTDQRPAPPDPAQLEAARQCMADKGFELPAPSTDENGNPTGPPEKPQIDPSQREAFEQAARDCGLPLRHGHGRGGPPDPAQAEAFRQCMADKGFELPAPSTDENGNPTGPPEKPQIDPSQREAFEQAVRDCGGPPGGHGGPGCMHDGQGPGQGAAPDEGGNGSDSTQPPTSQGSSLRPARPGAGLRNV